MGPYVEVLLDDEEGLQRQAVIEANLFGRHLRASEDTCDWDSGFGTTGVRKTPRRGDHGKVKTDSASDLARA